MEKCVGHTVV